MTKANKILLLFAHPSIRRSEVNKPMFDVACKLEGITAVDLYAKYPTFQIDIDEEQKLLVEHDIIIFQFPLYWYSTPSLLKEWQDLVLEHGFAYGENGDALKEKLFMCAITAGGPEEAYRKDGYNHFTIQELLYPLEQMANLTLMKYLPPFTQFGSRTTTDEGRLEACLKQWEEKLITLLNETNVSIKEQAEVSQ